MIEFDKISKHVWLDEAWCSRVSKTGIDMSDAQWFLFHKDDKLFVCSITERDSLISSGDELQFIPTYTIADILYKLNEYAWIDKDPEREWKNFHGGFKLIKDAPFYIFGYYNNIIDSEFRFDGDKKSLEVFDELPVISAARLLIVAQKNGIKCVKNISDKYEQNNEEIVGE